MKTMIITVALVIGQVGAVAADTEFEQKMNRFAEQSLAAFEVVPGMSVCVVKADRVVYLGSFGYRNVDGQLPVTADTGFYIASSTKSFTGMAASVLASRGTIDLDAPVSRYLPGLELPEPLSADAITLRAMLTHRTGVNNFAVQRQLAFTGALDKAAFFEMMRTQSKPMTTGFAYTNLGYNMMGYVLEEVTGKTWQEVVAENVLRPVGMSRTTTSIEDAAGGDFALPYARKGGVFEQLDLKTDATMQSAGGLVTTASDLGRWLITNLNDGRVDGSQALPRDAVREAHKAQATTDRDYYRFHRTGYGFGWYNADFEGELLIHHFGGFAGYHAHVSFMPEHGIGVAALINANDYEAGNLAHMVAAYAYETLLSHPDVETEYAQELRYRSARTQASVRYEEAVNEAMGAIMSGNTSEGTTQLVSALRDAREAGIGSEGGTNSLGYALLKREKTAAAITVFGFNVESYPESPNTYDSLGEAYEAAGQLDRARQSYAKAHEIAAATDDPNIELFKKNLDRVSALLN